MQLYAALPSPRLAGPLPLLARLAIEIAVAFQQVRDTGIRRFS